MSYVTLPVEIDHGRILSDELGKVPDRCSGFLTIISETAGSKPASPAERLRALHELRKSLALTPEKTAAWLKTIDDQKF